MKHDSKPELKNKTNKVCLSWQHHIWHVKCSAIYGLWPQPKPSHQHRFLEPLKFESISIGEHPAIASTLWYFVTTCHFLAENNCWKVVFVSLAVYFFRFYLLKETEWVGLYDSRRYIRSDIMWFSFVS